MKINYKVFNILSVLLAFVISRLLGSLIGGAISNQAEIISQATISVLLIGVLALTIYHTNKRFKSIKAYNIPITINTKSIPFIGIVMVIFIGMFFLMMNMVIALSMALLMIIAVINVMMNHKDYVLVDENNIYYNGRLIPIHQIIGHEREEGLLKLRLNKPFLFFNVIEEIEFPIKTETYTKLQTKL